MPQSTYISNLTSMRGIAAILTVIFHVNLMNYGSLHLPLLDKMYLMVDFFFILSGFIMMHVYGNWFSDSVSGDNFKKFTIARFARVYPLHFFTLMYTILLFSVSGALNIPKVPVFQIQNSGFSILTNLLLLQSMNMHTWFTWVHASWSISTEWWMYMLFPFLVVPFSKLKSTGEAAVAFLCFAGYLAITFWIVPLVTNPPEIPFVHIDPATLTINVAYQYGFLRCMFGFILGMMMYKGYIKNWGRNFLSNGYAIVLAVIGLLVCFYFEVPDIFSVSFLPFILLSGAYGSGSINKVLNTKILQKIGDWSFSIYLVHQPLMFTIGNIMAFINPVNPSTAPAGPPQPPPALIGWAICIAIIALTLFVSYLTYNFIEKPMRYRINRKPVPTNQENVLVGL